MGLHRIRPTGRLTTALLGLLGLGAGALLASACGSDINGFPTRCQAGETRGCTGPMDCQGFQTCADDGTKFGACDCGGAGGSGGESSAGSGGMSSSTGATGGASSGSGGDGGMGGASSGGGMGGDPNPDGCPPQAPQDNSGCTGNGIGMEPLVCEYGDATCQCSFNTWNCYTCPAQAPQDNSGCSDFGAQCTYGDTSCSCFGGFWDCTTCPPMQPTGPCNTPGAFCQYGNVNCSCFGGNWNCFGG